MIKINKPVHTFEACYQECQCSRETSALLQASMPALTQAHISYEELAQNASLCEYEAMTLEEPVQKALKNLYTDKLVSQKSSGCVVYNKILASSPLCPYCNVGFSRTLDHYLPKSKFPEFSINPLNLVPACRDCNTEKRDKVILNKDEQYIHPYFDMIDFQWLNAKITIRDKTPIFEYSVREEVLESTLGSRIYNHFYSFKIKKSCEMRANTRLQERHESFKSYKKNKDFKEEFKTYLTTEAKACQANHWEKSFYECLAASDEFCSLEWEM